jgi:hypothetical protein
MDLNKFLKVPIYFKIIKFFHENPASIDTPRGLAAWTGESRQNVKKALSKLADLKILTSHDVSSTTAYSYTRDSKLVKKVGASLKKIKSEEG